MLNTLTTTALAAVCAAVTAHAQPPRKPTAARPAASTAQPSQPPVLTSTVTVVGTMPLPSLDMPLNELPAPVQTATSRDLDASGALDVSHFLNERLTGVHVNNIQGNPFQADVSYRGYTASPLLGTPQGLSVYMDGVRLNQPFGDVVSWDLIPRVAIASMTLMPGSNPLFGLNTLGGALAIETKDGRHDPGTSLMATYGSFRRRAVQVEHGGSSANGLNWYVAGNLFADRGWRDDSPSDVDQLFGKLGWHGTATDVALSLGYADNSLTGNGLQDDRLLARDYASIYTTPDTTDNQAVFLNLTLQRRFGTRVLISANGYYRHLNADTLNGDLNEDSLDQPISLFDPAPFPLRQCLAAVQTGDDAEAWCDGLVNRTASRQNNAGASGQVTLIGEGKSRLNQLTIGAGYDANGTSFRQSTELGYLEPDRGVTGTGVFDEGVGLDGRGRTVSAFGRDVLTLDSRWHLTVSGRYNQTSLRDRDRIRPAGVAGSLDGDETFGRLNPAAGFTVDLPAGLNGYGKYSEGSRAPTSVELGCADPNRPCTLPNAMAGDPPLGQVVARTWEGGLRGGRTSAMRWHASVFRTSNDDDILFVASPRTGFGYFKNFGRTRRQGLELGASGRMGRLRIGGGYTLLDATYQSREIVNGEGNSSNSAAQAGIEGIDGTITIEPGDRLPLIPRHTLKAFADLEVRPGLSVDLDLVAASGAYARGNENNRHQPDGVYYLGPGYTRAYAVLNAGARWQAAPHLEIIAQIENVLNLRYSTAGALGPTGLTSAGTFVSRPFPAIAGEFPVRQTTFEAPGAPRTVWIGTRLVL